MRHVDGWPFDLPDDPDLDTVGWRLIHVPQQVTPSEMKFAAGIVGIYSALVGEGTTTDAINALRRARRAHAKATAAR